MMEKISNKILIPILILIMLQWAGAMYFYDFPQLFEPQLIKKFNISTIKVSLMYTFASAPNLIMNIFAAWLIEKIGLAVSTVVFSSTVFFGILICFFGFTTEKFEYLLIGRLIFGIGFDTMFLTQALGSERWFSGRFMTFAYALTRSCVYLFSTVALYYQPELFLKYRGFQVPMFVYACVAAFTFVTTAIFSICHLKKKHLLVDKKSKKAMESKFHFKDFKLVGFMPYLVVLYLAVMSNCYYQVMNFMTDMIVQRFGLSYIEAKNAGTLVPVVSMVAIPIMGFLFNKYGKKGIGMFVAGALATTTFVIMSFIPLGCDRKYVVWFVVMVALFRSVYTSCAWSCLVLSVPKQASSATVGFAATMQNLCLASFPPIFASFNFDRNYSAYQNSIYLLIGMSGLCTALSLVINFHDLRGDKLMHMPENDERVAKLKEKKMNEFSEKKIQGKEKSQGDYKSMQSGKTGKNLMEDEFEY